MFSIAHDFPCAYGEGLDSHLLLASGARVICLNAYLSIRKYYHLDSKYNRIDILHVFPKISFIYLTISLCTDVAAT